MIFRDRLKTKYQKMRTFNVIHYKYYMILFVKTLFNWVQDSDSIKGKKNV